MRRLFKLIKKIIISIVDILVKASSYLYFFAIKIPTSFSKFSDTRTHIWNKVTLDKTVISSDGSDYYIYSKKGNNDNLIIYFSGGGEAWDLETAANPFSLKTLLSGNGFGYYFARIPFYKLNLLNGMLNDNNKRNPFKDWNIVYIPYSTGDFHIGNTIVKYTTDEGKIISINHNGQNNTETGLQWTFNNIEKPKKLLICGESAGGFGSAIWTQYIANHYSNSEIYQFSDGAYLNTEKWPDVINKVWNADFEKKFGYTLDNDLIKDTFIYNGNKLRDKVIFLHSNTLFDGIQAAFQAKMNDIPIIGTKYIDTWSRGMLESTRIISESTPNYYYYITDYSYDAKTHTTTHTLTPVPIFYKVVEGDVKLYSWLMDIIENNKRYSVGNKFINK